jgi:hypothetical protein
MKRYLAVAAIAVLMSASSAFAADNTQNGADTSTGAKEQSSAPSGSGAEKDMSADTSAGTSNDTSTGAKEQSSMPPGSAAATGQPNASGGTASSSNGMKSSQP